MGNFKLKPVQCKNCKYFKRRTTYQYGGSCLLDGRDTKEWRVCELLDTDAKRREAKIKTNTEIN